MIHANALYHATEIKDLLPLTDHSLRRARREGLKVIYYCNHGYIVGRDLISFLEKTKSQEDKQEKEE